jgi:ADP-ribose pyrophosphatase
MIELGAGVASWDVLDTNMVLEHPFVTVAMETVRLPDGQTIPDWPKIYTNDYVNALILNEANEALVLEGYKHGNGRITWQIMGGYIEPAEDPLTAVQRELLEETGYQTEDWTYLGSYIVDPNRHVGVGHFFCAQKVRLTAEPCHSDLEDFAVKWVPLKELRYALLDGRIAAISHAITVSLALLTILK